LSRRRLRSLAPIVCLAMAYRFTGPASRLLHRQPLLGRLLTAEQRVFGSPIPTQRMQSARAVRQLAVPMTTIYLTHFVAPWVVTLVRWRRGAAEWQRWNRRFLILTAAGLTTYVLVPAAPPWMGAAETSPPIERTSLDGLDRLGLSRLRHLVERGQANVNEVAALPSMHTAYALLIALEPARSRRSAIGKLAYPVAMGATLVATGEHYVLDVAAGAALAALVAARFR
jgi:membrane-associated phospholipid phosphatase